MSSKIALFCSILIIISSSWVHTQKPARPHPPPDPEYNCPVDNNLPHYVPIHTHLSGVLNCPQSDTTWSTIDLWLQGFKKYHPDLTVEVPIMGSGYPGPCLIAGTCDCGLVAREMMLENELLPFIDHFGYEPLEVPISGGSYRFLAFTDAMVFMVHPSNPINQLTFAQLDAIFTTTRNQGYPSDITKWGQLGLTGEWADRDINLVGVQIPNGFEYFLNRTLTNGGIWKPNIKTEETVFNLSMHVASDPQSIGYTGLAYVDSPVKILNLISGPNEPAVKVTFDNVCSRQYPLSRYLYLYANKRPDVPLDPRIVELGRYILSREGQAAVEQDAVFLPLSASYAAAARAKLG